MDSEQVQKYEKLRNILCQKYPNQGFEQGITDATDKLILSWGTILDLAKQGRYEDIRPDIRVQQYMNLRAIRADEFFGVEPEFSVRRSPSGESITLSVRGRNLELGSNVQNPNTHRAPQFKRRRKMTDEPKSDTQIQD